jgi:hypothetical protein
MFVHPPFRDCPSCGAKRAFGVLMGCNRHYVRRCIQCRRDQTIPLPPLKKRIIYLDQFVISNIMKALDPTRPKAAKGESNEFFRNLFNMLDRLSKLQLIVCPDSPIHDLESIVDTRYEKLRAVFGHLSDGIGFREPEAIVHAQIMDAFDAWLSDKPYQNPVSRHFALTGNPDVWQDRLRIELNHNIPGLANELSAARHATTAGLHAVCTRWRSDPNFSFKQIFEEELVGHAKKILGQFFNYVRRLRAYQSGNVPLDDAVCFPPAAFSLLTRMLSALESQSATMEERIACIWGFFASDHFRSVSALRISALFLATIAREVHSGRGPDKFPKGGVFNDIDTVAAYSPFCDAMFVDKEISHFAKQRELKKELSTNGRLFSLRANEKAAFIDFLKSIETDASGEHLRLVEEVYGPDWATPFEELLSIVQKRGN